MLGLLGSLGTVRAASPNILSGELLGEVKSAPGIAQMGAAVYLYNRYDELVRRSLTTQDGRFAFDGLAPDLYSLRVILASFVPAERHNIAVLPNSQNRLDINLSSVLSTVQLTSMPASPGTLMTDEWKWVLRASQSTRPVMRMLPEITPQSPSSSTALTTHAVAFSNTTGVVKISAGDGQSFARGSQQDLGTAFAMATSLAGAGRVQLSGNLNYANNSALPGAGLRTSFSRPTESGSSPEFVVTMRQVYLAPRGGLGILFASTNAPALRTMSLAFVDKFDVAENIRVEYGFDFQSVAYLDRLNFMSPFLRATYDAGEQGRVRVAFSSGARPTELLARDSHGLREQTGSELEQNLTALASMPSLSLSDSHVAVQRTQNMEVGYERVAGSRTFSFGAYRENVSNAAFMLSAPADFLPAEDLLPDLSSRSSIFNLGSFQRTGYTAAVKQMLGDHTEVSVAVGRTGALMAPAEANGTDSGYGDSQQLRAGIRQGQRNWVTLRVAGTVPLAGTRLAANYGWTDFRVLMPAHLFVTQNTNQDIGVNVYIRQPLPVFSGMPWRLEMTAELRNLLAQGYLPLGGAGTRSVLTNSPRAVRGGLNFIF